MLTLPDLSTPYGRYVFRRKVEEGWEPMPGTYWSVMSSRGETKSYLPVVRAGSAGEALAMAVEQATDEGILGPLFVCGKQEVTDADVLAWREFKERALAGG